MAAATDKTYEPRLWPRRQFLRQSIKGLCRDQLEEQITSRRSSGVSSLEGAKRDHAVCQVISRRAASTRRTPPIDLIRISTGSWWLSALCSSRQFTAPPSEKITSPS